MAAEKPARMCTHYYKTRPDTLPRPSQGDTMGMVWYGILEFNVPLDTV